MAQRRARWWLAAFAAALGILALDHNGAAALPVAVAAVGISAAMALIDAPRG